MRRKIKLRTRLVSTGVSSLLLCQTLTSSLSVSALDYIRSATTGSEDSRLWLIKSLGNKSIGVYDIASTSDTDLYPYLNTELYKFTMKIPTKFSVKVEGTTKSDYRDNTWSSADGKFTYSIMLITITHSEEEVNSKGNVVKKTVTDEQFSCIAVTGCTADLIDLKGYTTTEIPQDIYDAFTSNYIKEDETKTYNLVSKTGVLAIGEKAFSKSNLKTVDLTGIEYIGANAFSSCTYLPVVEIPKSVKYMSNGVFSDSGLKTLTCHNDMMIIPDSLCKNSALSSIKFDSPDLILKVGSYTFSNTVLKEYPLTDAKNCVLIGDYAFSGCSQLLDLTLTDNIQRLNEHSFEKCTALRSIKLGTFTEVIDRMSFADCTSLVKVELNDVLSSLGGLCFENCTSLVSFPAIPSTLHDWIEITKGVGYGFGDGTFSGCTSLKTVSFPDTITEVPPKTFNNCTSLTDVRFDGSIKAIRENAFTNCKNLQILNLKTPCKYVETSAFSGCESLRTTVSDEYDYLGDTAYKGCTALTEVKVSVNNTDNRGKGVFTGCTGIVSAELGMGYEVSIPANMFMGCTSLKNVSGDALQTINIIYENAFSGCESLEILNLPSLKIIESGVFAKCSSLQAINEGEISATDIGVNAFLNCTNLSQPVNSTANTIGNYAFKGSGITSVKIVGTDGTTIVLGDSVFSGCSALTSADITVTETMQYKVGSSLFSDCTALTDAKYTGVEIPKAMYSNCTSLTKLELPNAKVANESCFSNCAALETLEMGNDSNSNGVFQSVFAGAFNNCSKIDKTYCDKTTTFAGNKNYYGCASIKEAEVSYLTDSMFSGCTLLEKITLSDTIVSLPSGCFNNCSSLKTFNFNNVLDIGDGCFTGAGITGKFNFSGNSIGKEAFKGCTNITGLDLSIATVSNSAFANTGIETASLSTNKIGTTAFQGCSQLKTVTFENTDEFVLSEIGTKAFYDCESLKEVTLPDTLTAIGAKAMGTQDTEFIIQGVSDSEANKYATTNKITFIDINAKDEPIDTPVDTNIQGDINADGAVTSADLVLLIKYLLLNSDNEVFNTAVADINSDGVVNILDLQSLKRYLLTSIEMEIPTVDIDEAQVAAVEAFLKSYIAEHPDCTLTEADEVLQNEGFDETVIDYVFDNCNLDWKYLAKQYLQVDILLGNKGYSESSLFTELVAAGFSTGVSKTVIEEANIDWLEQAYKQINYYKAEDTDISTETLKIKLSQDGFSDDIIAKALNIQEGLKVSYGENFANFMDIVCSDAYYLTYHSPYFMTTQTYTYNHNTVTIQTKTVEENETGSIEYTLLYVGDGKSYAVQDYDYYAFEEDTNHMNEPMFVDLVCTKVGEYIASNNDVYKTYTCEFDGGQETTFLVDEQDNVIGMWFEENGVFWVEGYGKLDLTEPFAITEDYNEVSKDEFAQKYIENMTKFNDANGFGVLNTGKYIDILHSGKYHTVLSDNTDIYADSELQLYMSTQIKDGKELTYITKDGIRYTFFDGYYCTEAATVGTTYISQPQVITYLEYGAVAAENGGRIYYDIYSYREIPDGDIERWAYYINDMGTLLSIENVDTEEEIGYKSIEFCDNVSDYVGEYLAEHIKADNERTVYEIGELIVQF